MTIICRNFSGNYVLSISKHIKHYNRQSDEERIRKPLHEILKRENFTLKVVVEELAELVVLTRQVREVDEEPAAHVALHGLDLLWPGGPVVLNQEVAILEEATAADLLRALSRDQLLVEMY